MSGRSRQLLPVAATVLAAAWMASTIDAPGDWGADSWPAVNALAHLDLSGFLAAKPLMGPFATIVEAPFAAISAGGVTNAYMWASFPCLLAAGALGLYLARIAARGGASRPTQVLIAGICVVNPLSYAALEEGHPEEILTAALAVGAVATAAGGHRWRTAVLLGLAVSSKQWAVIAILPALLALPSPRIRVGLVAMAIPLALILPDILHAPGSFAEVNGAAASTGGQLTAMNVWYPFAVDVTETFHYANGSMTVQVEEAPAFVGLVSHPLIVALAFMLPLGLVAWRRRLPISGTDAIGLLAMLALLRCALDPVDNVYYHTPLLLALIAWDALDPGRLPVRTLAGTGLALLFWHWVGETTDLVALSSAYIATAAVGVAAIAASVFRRSDRSRSALTPALGVMSTRLTFRPTKP